MTNTNDDALREAGEPWGHAVRAPGGQHWVLASNFPPDMAKAIVHEGLANYDVQPLYAHPAPASPPETGEGMSERDQIAYWRQGHEIIEACLRKSTEGKHEDAPFPLDAEQAGLYHTAQMEAYRHALEMMGVPEAALSSAPASPDAEKLKEILSRIDEPEPEHLPDQGSRAGEAAAAKWYDQASRDRDSRVRKATGELIDHVRAALNPATQENGQ